MGCLTKFDRTELKQRIDAVNKSFKTNKHAELFNRAYNREIPLDHWLVIDRIHRTNFEKMSDIELIMFCGIFDFSFHAGCYGYNKDQCLSVNRLNDFIFALKHMTLKERKMWIKEGN